ncbi:MAG: nucleotide exchange factor GrpE [Syntrophothermus sp.]
MKFKKENNGQDQENINKEEQQKQITDSAEDENIEVLRNEIEIAKSKLEQLEKEVQDYKDKLLRKAAEFENYKRRTQDDQLSLLKYAAESFIVKLLPVVDDFERSLTHIESSNIEALRQGIKLIYDKFIKVLEEQGVKRIESTGQHFDVNFHEALMQRLDKSALPMTVLDELEKGYMYKDKVIRHSKVIVNEDYNISENNTEEK